MFLSCSFTIQFAFEVKCSLSEDDKISGLVSLFTNEGGSTSQCNAWSTHFVLFFCSRTVVIQNTKTVKLAFHCYNNQQLLDEVEQNIMICHWQADQLFAQG